MRFSAHATCLRVRRYEHAIAAYCGALAARGVRCVPTALQRCALLDGRVVVYLAQPRLRPECLLPEYMRGATRGAALTVFRAVMGAIVGAVDARVGLDGQLSNWVRCAMRVIISRAGLHAALVTGCARVCILRLGRAGAGHGRPRHRYRGGGAHLCAARVRGRTRLEQT